MADRLYSLMLTRFTFPKSLEGNRANFRFLVTVRYVAPKGKLMSETVVMPGLDVYWECDPRKRSDPAYVRVAGKPEMDVDGLDPWDRLILHMKAEAIHSLQFRVMDVDRRDAWDRIREALRDIVGFILRRGRDALPLVPPEPLQEAFGSAAEDLQSWVLQKLAAQKDKLLYRGSHFFEDPAEPEPGPIQGRGVGGAYHIEFEVRAA